MSASHSNGPEAGDGVPAEDVVRTIDAGRFRLVFRWEDARWTHSIEVAGRRLADAIEWDANSDDPGRVVSPAYQQLSFQEDGDSSLALLVGQWGLHHFSGVFRLTPQLEGAALDVDVAVRTRTPIVALAGTYRVDLPSGALTGADPSAVEWAPDDLDPGLLRLEPLDPATGRVGMAEAGRRATRVQAEALLTATASGSAYITHRLTYRWRWIEASGL